MEGDRCVDAVQASPISGLTMKPHRRAGEDSPIAREGFGAVLRRGHRRGTRGCGAARSRCRGSVAGFRPRRCADSRRGGARAPTRAALSARRPRAAARPRRGPTRSRAGVGGPSKSVGDGGHLPQVRGHVFAGLAVAAGEALHEAAALVDQLDSRAVELGLRDQVEDLGQFVVRFPLACVLLREHAPDPGIERAHLVGIHRVVERQHRRAMGRGLEALHGGRSDALGRRVGREESGVARPRVATSSRRSASYSASVISGASSW